VLLDQPLVELVEAGSRVDENLVFELAVTALQANVELQLGDVDPERD
jgi:hypothetical protein